MESLFLNWKGHERAREYHGYQCRERPFGLRQVRPPPHLRIDKKAVLHLVVSRPYSLSFSSTALLTGLIFEAFNNTLQLKISSIKIFI